MLFLSFESQEQADAVLFDADGEKVFANTDVIGVIYKPTGATEDVDGMQIPVMAPIAGWHVNVLLSDGEDGSVLEPFAVTPKTPIRVFA